MPTAEEIDRMDAATAEKSLRSLGVVRSDSLVFWSVDGVRTTAKFAKGIPADSIANVSVDRLDASGSPHVYVNTKQGQLLTAVKRDAGDLVRRRGSDERDPFAKLESQGETERPLVLVDGVKSDLVAIKALDRARIEAIEIVKGPAAIREYGDAAKWGVIVIKMKAAGAK